MKCPKCSIKLERVQAGHRVYWSCRQCDGRVLGVSLLRRMFDRDVIDRMWRRAVTNDGISARACPDCQQRMIEVAATDQPAPRVEVCRTCHVVWFDAGEMATIKPLPAMTIDRRMPQKARELLAMARLERMALRPAGDDWAGDQPDTWWKSLAGFFGLPVEFDARTAQRRPWATWIVSAAIAIVSFTAFPYLEEAVSEFGLIPADAWRHGGATWITAFFLHGGILHLAGNLYFFLTFGDDVEDYCGPARFLLLLSLATLAGNMAHIMAGPGSQTPCIGASGGISGIIAFYALKFPGARLGFVWGLSSQMHWIKFPAWLALVLWTLLQFIGIWQQVAGFSNVSAAAHLGGAFAGFCAWLLSVKQAGPQQK